MTGMPHVLRLTYHMIGGIGAMVPERRAEIVGLGLKSIVAGTLATLMTGAVAGMLTKGL